MGNIEYNMLLSYMKPPHKDIKDLTDKELEQAIYENINETHDKRQLKRLINERNRRSKDE